MTQETSYRQLEGISQSLLKKLWTDPSYYKNAPESNESYFLFGSIVDCLLTEPDKFNEKYTIAVATPTDTVKNIIDGYLEITKDYELTNEEDLIKFAKNKNYESRMVDMVKYLAKLKNETTLIYSRFLEKASDKTIIDSEMFLRAKDSENAIRNDEHFRWLFDDTKYTIYDKVVVQFYIDDKLCKAELDRVLVDIETQEIFPIDFKTTSKKIHTFKTEFFNYRYDIQASWYRIALNKWAREILNIEEPVINNFYFAVVESTPNPKARMFVATTEIMNNAEIGYTNKYGDYVEGIDDLLERLDYHEVYGFNYPADYLKNGGVYILE